MEQTKRHTEPGRYIPGRLEKKMFRMPTEKEIQRTRTLYPAGTMVELISMEDPYAHPKAGEMGTVQFIDDIGQIHVRWDCGSGLALIPGVDRFRKA